MNKGCIYVNVLLHAKKKYHVKSSGKTVEKCIKCKSYNSQKIFYIFFKISTLYEYKKMYSSKLQRKNKTFQIKFKK